MVLGQVHKFLFSPQTSGGRQTRHLELNDVLTCCLQEDQKRYVHDKVVPVCLLSYCNRSDKIPSTDDNLATNHSS